MATKTKKKKPTKSKKVAAKKAVPKKAAKKLLKKKPTPHKKVAAKRAAPKTAPKKTAKKATAKRPTRQKAEVTLEVSPEARNARVSEGAGDLQGLSSTASADSESVDELLEEGNSFEAEAVKGVQDADDADEQEVHTHEVPEDDVPEEYTDKDSQ
jgi:hypothetical protein